MSRESDEVTGSEWSGLLETSSRFGAYSWLEQKIFQIFGGWAGNEADPELAVMFDEHSRRHAWHASVWFDRLPELSNVDAPSLIRAPSEGMVEFANRLAALVDPLDRLVAGYEVAVTRIAVAYRRDETRLDRVGNPSSLHWLRLMLQNLTDELLMAAERIVGAVANDSDVDRLAVSRSTFEKLWLEAGWPEARSRPTPG